MELVPLLKEAMQGHNEKTGSDQVPLLTTRFTGTFILYFTPSRLIRNISVTEGVQYFLIVIK